MCNWKDDYSHMVLLNIPPHMDDYRAARIEAGLSDKVCVDECIVKDIQELWSKGIITYGCCCGHNGQFTRMVNVDESNIQQMLDMGYKQNHPDKTRKDTFEL